MKKGENISFAKYQATLNDFIIIDESGEGLTSSHVKGNLAQHEIIILCDRRRGAGADGLFIIKKIEKSTIPVLYFDFYNIKFI